MSAGLAFAPSPRRRRLPSTSNLEFCEKISNDLAAGFRDIVTQIAVDQGELDRLSFPPTTAYRDKAE
jgi:hypothetical protein